MPSTLPSLETGMKRGELATDKVRPKSRISGARELWQTLHPGEEIPTTPGTIDRILEELRKAGYIYGSSQGWMHRHKNGAKKQFSKGKARRGIV